MQTVAWILKTEPETYGWNDLEAEGIGLWDGVRNFRARNFMQEMQPGQKALIYHSGKDRAIVGLAEITTEAFPDPTDASGKFVSVRLKPLYKLQTPVKLTQIKEMAEMAESLILKQTRLSVIPVNQIQLQVLLSND